MSLIFSNLVVSNIKLYCQNMYNLYAKYVKILEICKQFSENLVNVGANGFTMANDENGNKIRIYSLGKVVIGNNVEIGAHDNVSRGSGGDTVIEDNVKIDALIHIGHDAHLHKNVEITAGAVVGGFVDAQEGAYIGINSVIRNRVTLGAQSFIGMGATVTKSVPAGITVVGNPAKPFEKK